MLEGKECEAVDIVLPSVVVFIGRVTRFVQSAPMTRARKTYTELVVSMING